MTPSRNNPAYPRIGIEAPSPLGLLGFGLTALVFNLNGVGMFPLDEMVLAIALFYGGVWQIGVGLWEWRSRRPFGASTLVSLGFFWISLLALMIFPRAGFGLAPEATAFAPLLVFWGLFTLGLAGGALALGPLLPVLFATTALSFLIQAAGIAFGHSGLLLLAGYAGIIGSLIALFTSAIQILDFFSGRPVTCFGWRRA